MYADVVPDSVGSDQAARKGEGVYFTSDAAIQLVKSINESDGLLHLYSNETPILKKIETIAKELYGADKVEFNDEAKKKITEIEKAGFKKFPVCIAKTQYSFSIDPKLKGAPSGHTLQVREVILSSGAKFIVVICGSIMTMPGLPKEPASNNIKLNNKEEIEGLF